MNARHYRKHLYHHRAHPASANTAAASSQSSAIYLSVIAFVSVEYLLQLKTEKVPSGLIFPFGFLFFWAFYYTYYQPGSLEKTLSSEKKWDLTGIPMILMSSCIWFFKVVFVELTEKIISSLFDSNKQTSNPKQKHAFNHSKQNGSSRLQDEAFDNRFQSNSSNQTRPKIAEPIELIPKELLHALTVLGIPEAREWSLIQKRYRELAKQFHPDLNPDKTQAGNRFILLDSAYRKLEASRGRFLKARKSS